MRCDIASTTDEPKTRSIFNIFPNNNGVTIDIRDARIGGYILNTFVSDRKRPCCRRKRNLLRMQLAALSSVE